MIGTKKSAIALACGILLAGCSSLPTAGPLTQDVLDQASAGTSGSRPQGETNYVVADINPSVLELLKSQPDPSLYAQFGDVQSPAQGTIRARDQIALTIWETGPGGLFSGGVAGSGSGGAPAQTTQIPVQTVAADGSILVPYAGRLQLAGRTPAEAQAVIEARLHGTAAQPQVLVTIAQGYADQVTLSGDDIKGALIPLSSSGGRVLDVIALAGGIQSPVYAAWVQLVRDGISVTVPLQNIMQQPSENIRLQPGDNLIVSKNPEFFTVLGATGNNSQILFDADHVSLSEALGRAGGLRDERADAAGVFVFRYASRETAMRLCSSCRFPENQALVPVAFRLNMRKAQNFFAAQSFRMNDHDVLYIANAEQVQVEKVLSTVRDFLSPVITGAVVDRAVNP